MLKTFIETTYSFLKKDKDCDEKLIRMTSTTINSFNQKFVPTKGGLTVISGFSPRKSALLIKNIIENLGKRRSKKKKLIKIGLYNFDNSIEFKGEKGESNFQEKENNSETLKDKISFLIEKYEVSIVLLDKERFEHIKMKTLFNELTKWKALLEKDNKHIIFLDQVPKRKHQHPLLPNLSKLERGFRILTGMEMLLIKKQKPKPKIKLKWIQNTRHNLFLESLKLKWPTKSINWRQ